MKKPQMQQLKKRIKHHVPEIIVGTTLVLGATALIYLCKSQETEALIALTNEEWAKIASGDAAKIVTDAGTLWIAKEYHI